MKNKLNVLSVHVLLVRVFVFIALAAIIGFLAACGDSGNNTSKTVTSIAVTTKPTKTNYDIGGTLDTAGMVVTATYSDGSTAAVTGYTISGFDSAATGDKTITVTYEGKTAAFTVTILPAGSTLPPDETLIGIAVTTQPTKTNYNIGETLDTAGMVVTAIYSGSITVAVTGYTTSGFDSATPGDKTVTVTYEGKTATFTVTILPRTFTGIAVTTQPTKTTYKIGDTLDTAGMVVTAAYSDGSTAVVTGYTTDGFDSTMPGYKTITVTYEGKTAAFTVTIFSDSVTLPPGLTLSIAVTTQPTKTNYYIGDILNTAGMVVTATLSNGISGTVPAKDYIISGFDSATAGEKTITVSVFTVTFEGITETSTATFKVVVNALTVSMAAITGVTVPRTYGTPVTSIAETAQYSGTVTWSPEVSGIFTVSTEYTATITLTAKPNYTLQGVAENFFRVAGATTTTNAENSGVVKAVFPSTVPITPISMVRVEGGSFQMGKELGTAGKGDTTPVHKVTLTSFYMSKYPVTQDQYQMVMGTNPSYFRNPANPAYGEVQGMFPVDSVTWYDAVEFCNKLSEREGLQTVYTISDRTPSTGYPITRATVTADFGKTGYRLPTEAQWEYAAKGGNTPGNYTYSGSNKVLDVAWLAENGGIHEVGKLAPNGLGLYDMSGNVNEWCWDWYGSYTSGEQTDPVGPSTGSYWVLRGGGWNITVEYPEPARLVYRGYFNNRSSQWDDMRFSIGFRIVRP